MCGSQGVYDGKLFYRSSCIPSITAEKFAFSHHSSSFTPLHPRKFIFFVKTVVVLTNASNRIVSLKDIHHRSLTITEMGR